MRYYINRNTSDHGEHELHKETCSYLPDADNRILIGSFNSDSEALNVAKVLKSTWLIDGCKWCCPSIHRM